VGLTDATTVVGGWQNTCARRASGALVCWGDNRAGQIGDGTARVNRGTPTSVSGITDAVQVTLGSFHTCALRAGGSALCWGDDMFGQLGNSTSGTSLSFASPVAVTGLTDATTLGAGWTHTCAVRASGAVVCWGYNSEGRLGDGTMIDRNAPNPVTGLTDAVELAGGIGHICARRATGAVVCWGRNSSGQLGDGTTVQRSVPTPVAGLTDAVEVVSRMETTCARRRDGTVVCWGPGVNPDGTALSRTSPTPVAGVTDATGIAVAGYSFCALRASGGVVCWGGFELGQLGIGPLRDVAL
jgi:alpha-tubulin suppressor-like RCC1 family protein